MNIKRTLWIAPAVVCAAALVCGAAACQVDAGAAPSVDPSPYRIAFSGPTATVKVSPPATQPAAPYDVYLVKANKSAQEVSAAYAGSADSYWGASFPQAPAQAAPAEDGTTTPPASDAPFMDSPQALAWKPSEALWKAQRARDALNDAARSVGAAAASVEGDGKTFWVNDNYGGGAVWRELPATLRAQGAHCNVWVADVDYDNASAAGNDDGTINSAQAAALGGKFDILYPIETNLFGYEFGGDPARPGELGGRDGDARVQILVYKNAMTGLGGYFWMKDWYAQSNLSSTVRTNYAEIFYLNSTHLDKPVPSFMYSTLAHEFQHMINFNMKGIRQGLLSVPTWYDEMLSMLAEDVLDPFIGIEARDGGHPIQERMPAFLATYNDYDLEYWMPSNAAMYPKNYAFGAYLVRNFGGPALLQKMLANNSVGVASISAALGDITPNMSFQNALDRYGEALVYSGASDAVSFNRSVAQTVGGQPYAFAGFDIWTMARNPGPGTGPRAYSASDSMKGYAVQLQLIRQNVSGDSSVTLNKPDSASIDLYIMTRARP
ncbi:MAG: hypothetical protein LBS82_06335 [Spirochaetaceae bacterium]|jgi:hypothetical protein|nr:hypothetical protein [Spirochaetaceae bacterium]